MIVLAFITDSRVVRKILDHLRLPATDPPRAPARLSRKQMEMFEEGTGEEFFKKLGHRRSRNLACVTMNMAHG